MKRLALTALLGACVTSLLMTSVMAGSVTTESNGVRVELQSTPGTPVADQKATYTVRLVDGAGAPITDARVTLTGHMADGMSIAAPLRAAGEAGVYRGEVLFTMAGAWDLTVRVMRPTGRAEIPLREDVGRGR